MSWLSGIFDLFSGIAATMTGLTETTKRAPITRANVPSVRRKQKPNYPGHMPPHFDGFIFKIDGKNRFHYYLLCPPKITLDKPCSPVGLKSYFKRSKQQRPTTNLDFKGEYNSAAIGTQWVSNNGKPTLL